MFRNQKQTNFILDSLSYIILIGTVIFAVFPLVWTFLTSIKVEKDIVTSDLQYIPRQVTFDNYVAVWQRSGFPVLIGNSVVVTILTLLICVLIGTLAAYSLSRYRFRLRNTLLLLYLVVRMFPAVLLLIPLFIMLRNLSLYDTRQGLALAYTAFLLPVCVWMMKGFFDAIPVDIEDAARIDGCTRLEALFRVVLPLALSGLVATAVFIGIAAWNEYLFALMLTSGQGSRTWPVGLQLMVGEFQLPWGSLSAGGIISIVPVIVLFSIVQRSLIQGITAGAVKG